MLSALTDPNLLLTGLILAVVQAAAALPWLRAIDPRRFAAGVRNPSELGPAVLGVVAAGVAVALYLGQKGESSGLVWDGRVYGAVLHLQLMLDLFILAPLALTVGRSRRGSADQSGLVWTGVLAGAVALAVLAVPVLRQISPDFGARVDAAWAIPVVKLLGLFAAAAAGLFALGFLVGPKAGAVALAAYRESWRQPLFWLVVVLAVVATWVSVIIPYFTFGDDFKMMKQIGFDIVMLAGVLFGVLAAATSVSEEIEGRTALTVMSKPVNRRQFLIGKYLGILMACGGMTLLLGWNLNGACLANPEFDKINYDRAYDPMPEEAKAFVVPAVQRVFPQGPGQAVAQGAGMWGGETFANSFGLLLGFGQVMVLVAIATALATRLPFIVNLVLNLFVYFLGHLAPVLVRVGEQAQDKTSLQAALTRFVGNLFDTLLPALEFFNMGPAIIRDTPLRLWDFAAYVGTVSGYAVIYSVIALVVGLLLFEDRDLA